DYYPTSKDYITIQGDVYAGEIKSKPEGSPYDGQNIIGRWTRTWSPKSDLALQVYFDRYWIENPLSISDEMETYDLDLRHRFSVGQKHNVVWGMGYRFLQDEVHNRSAAVSIVPEKRDMPRYSAFVQDEISVLNNLKFTLGTKLLHT